MSARNANGRDVVIEKCVDIGLALDNYHVTYFRGFFEVPETIERNVAALPPSEPLISAWTSSRRRHKRP